MTTEERAKAVHEGLTLRSLFDYHVDVKLIADAIRAAILEEREACATLIGDNRILSGSPGPLFSAGWHAANDHAEKLIRARK